MNFNKVLNQQMMVSQSIVRFFLTAVKLSFRPTKVPRWAFQPQCIRNSTYRLSSHRLCFPIKLKAPYTIWWPLLPSSFLNSPNDCRQTWPTQNHKSLQLPLHPKECCLVLSLCGWVLLCEDNVTLSANCKKCVGSSGALTSLSRCCYGGRKACIQTADRYPSKMRTVKLQ